MDSSNFQNYRNGRDHKYIGGRVTKSPVRLQMPRSGHWHVAVDLMGLHGSVKSSARLLPNPLPTIQEAPLSSVPSLVQQESPLGIGEHTLEYDVFISHASEDKEALLNWVII